MSKFAIIALLPEDPHHPQRQEFMSKEFDTPEEVGGLLTQLEELMPEWRAVTICHIEDLPLLQAER